MMGGPIQKHGGRPMSKYLAASLLIIGIANFAFAADGQAPAQRADREYVGDGAHPDPCWLLRVQRHRDTDSWLRFEDCVARHNYNN
jgi:hypothetical protein